MVFFSFAHSCLKNIGLQNIFTITFFNLIHSFLYIFIDELLRSFEIIVCINYFKGLQMFSRVHQQAFSRNLKILVCPIGGKRGQILSFSQCIIKCENKKPQLSIAALLQNRKYFQIKKKFLAFQKQIYTVLYMGNGHFHDKFDVNVSRMECFGGF